MEARVAIVIPTADPEREPARTAIARARATTAHLGATLHVITSSGPEFRFARSVNRGMNEAPEADAWVLLNDDCFMDDGWLEAMLDTARGHPEVGIVGAVLRYPSGRIQHAGGHRMGPFLYLAYSLRRKAPFWGARAFLNQTLRGVQYFGHSTRLDPRRRLDYVTAACMLVTRPCREALGGFDEAYPFTFEDVDVCLRALDRGFEVGVATQARGVHLHQASSGGMAPRIRESVEVFRSRWSRRRVLALLRRGGRRGIYHGGDRSASCGCATESHVRGAAV